MNVLDWQQLSKCTGWQNNWAPDKNMKFIFTQLSLQRDPNYIHPLEEGQITVGWAQHLWNAQPKKNSWKKSRSLNWKPLRSNAAADFFKSVKLLWISSGGIQFWYWPEHSVRAFELWQWNIQLYISTSLHLYPVPRVVRVKSPRGVQNKQDFE